MADTTVDDTVNGQIDTRQGAWGPYWSDISTAVIIYVDSDNDLQYARTTDKGANWTLVELLVGTIHRLAAWYDQETPGDTGTLVHFVYMESAGDDFFYRTIDVTDATLGTERTIAALTTVDTNGGDLKVCLTKSRNANLYAGYYSDGSQEIDFLRSVDAGVNWVSRAALYEAGAGNNDFARLFPANTGDDADICALYWDSSVNDITVKMYDDSANTWTETNIDTDATDNSSLVNMDGAIRHSDSHLLMGFHSNDDNAGDDLRTYDLTVDSIASPTITAKTNIFTNQGESAQAAVFINQQNDDVYFAYVKGNPSWAATCDIVYHISTDGMGVWGSEQAYSEASPDDLRYVQSGRTVGDDGGRYQPIWFNDDLLDLFINEVNDVEIAASAAVFIPEQPVMVEQAINRAAAY